MEELFKKLQEAGKTEESYASEESLRAAAEELMDIMRQFLYFFDSKKVKG